MSRHFRLLFLGVAALVLGARPATAQFALDAEVRRAIITYQAGRYEAAVVELTRAAARPGVTTPDVALASLYRGFALLRLKRDAEARKALETAVMTDPTLRPDPLANSAELIEAWNRARTRVPIIKSFSLAPLEFVTGLDSGMSVSYQFDLSQTERRYAALVRFLLVRLGTADTIVAWDGTEGTPVRWNGLVRGEAIAPGAWEFVLEARAPASDVRTYLHRRAEIDVAAMSDNRLLPPPARPRFLPETLSYNRVDDVAKQTRITRGLILLGVGAALSVYSQSAYRSAIDESPKGSSQRLLVAGAYVGGAASIGLGGWYALTGFTRKFETAVSFPSAENIRRNREMRQQFTVDSTQVAERNRAAGSGRLVRIRLADEGSR